MQKLKYDNIAISGLIGTGTTTLYEGLRSVFPKWKYFSGGLYMREYAIKHKLFDPNNKGHHLATCYGDEFDRKADFGMRKDLGEKKYLVIESWLCGFMAQGLPKVLKVLLISDDALRIDRIVNRDGLAVEEAKMHIRDRENENLKKWIRMYSKEWNEWVVKPGIIKPDEPIYFWDSRLYDLVIDTYSHSKEETLDLVLKALGMLD